MYVVQQVEGCVWYNRMHKWSSCWWTHDVRNREKTPKIGPKILIWNFCTYWLKLHKILYVISGFHRALLQSTTSISRLNAFDYTKVLRPSYRTHTPQDQNYAAKHRPSTRQTSVNHYEFQSSTAPYSLMMDRVTIRNMSEWFLISCLLKFLYNVNFNF